mgnify:CR=1 FL=1|jgi:hypothetical protein|tara:strand:- start:130 stop:387 length:258 start_codon:yes stop_codon:yes gene_type:complete
MAKIIEEAKILGEIDAGDGRMVPHIRCRSETTITNTKTNQEYDSEEHATNDVADPSTSTKKEHIRRDVKIFAPSLADMVGTSDND